MLLFIFYDQNSALLHKLKNQGNKIALINIALKIKVY